MSKQLLPLLLILCLAVGVSAATTEQYRQIRVPFETPDQINRLHQLGFDVVWRGEGYVDIVVNESEFALFQSEGIQGKIVHESVVDFYRTRLLAEKGMGGYKTLSEIYDTIDSIIAANPDIMTARQSIGQTIEGRDQWAFKISDNPDIDEDEPEVLYTAAIHAREVITPEALLYYISYLVDNYGIDSTVTNIVDNRELWFILVVNPDGYYRNEVIAPGGGGMWRKNRRDNNDGTYGVDLNRNFGYRWGYDNTGSSPSPVSETYRGLAPFSEPETQNLRDFAVAHNFVAALYLHSYSNLIIWPWGYTYKYTDDEDVFAAIGDSLNAYNGYVSGPGASTIYPTNGDSDDWYYGEDRMKKRTISLTIEIGGESDGFWPPYYRIPTLVEENRGALLYLARVADRMFAIRSPRAPAVEVDTLPPSGDYTVSWSHEDTLNPAVSYDLVEYRNPIVFSDSANSLDGWQTDGFEVSTARSSSGPTSFHAGPAGGHLQYLAAAHPLKIEAGDTLRFITSYFLTTDREYAYVEVSTDGHDFEAIPGNITTDTNPFGLNLGNGITGQLVGIEGIFDLSAYVGQEIMIRFTYRTYPNSVQEGIYIDDIYPRPAFEDSTVLATGLADSSFEVTGRADGWYWYQVRARDADNQLSVPSAAARTEVGYIPPCCTGSTGDVDCSPDGTVDISDVQTLIDNLFLSLTPLCCETSANMNYPGSGAGETDTLVDITDLSILIDNQFLTLAPLPACP